VLPHGAPVLVLYLRPGDGELLSVHDDVASAYEVDVSLDHLDSVLPFPADTEIHLPLPGELDTLLLDVSLSFFPAGLGMRKNRSPQDEARHYQDRYDESTLIS
jgi:hypothetical protein